jgi:hypothetical protein
MSSVESVVKADPSCGDTREGQHSIRVEANAVIRLKSQRAAPDDIAPLRQRCPRCKKARSLDLGWNWLGEPRFRVRCAARRRACAATKPTLLDVRAGALPHLCERRRGTRQSVCRRGSCRPQASRRRPQLEPRRPAVCVAIPRAAPLAAGGRIHGSRVRSPARAIRRKSSRPVQNRSNPCKSASSQGYQVKAESGPFAC